MSKESAIQFLEKARDDVSVQTILSNKEMPKDKEGLAGIYAEIAEQLGENISAKDFSEAIEAIEEKRRRKTEKSVSDMEALDDDDLEDVAGGMRDTVCFANVYCYTAYQESPPDRKDVPCKLDYNCVVLNAKTFNCDWNFWGEDDASWTQDDVIL